MNIITPDKVDGGGPNGKKGFSNSAPQIKTGKDAGGIQRIPSKQELIDRANAIEDARTERKSRKKF